LRISKEEAEAIKQRFVETFKNGKIYLFGSCVDDTKRGGDIDLYIIPSQNVSFSEIFDKKLEFLRKLQDKIGEQKIKTVQ
jgi:predicted nucleotidyltransferase